MKEVATEEDKKTTTEGRVNYLIPKDLSKIKKEELPLPVILLLQCHQGNAGPVKLILSMNKVDIMYPILA